MSVTIYGNGQVPIQVAQGTINYTSGVSTSSSSFVTTGLTVSITPKSASNKVLLFVDGTVYNGSTGVNNLFTIYRNGTNLNGNASPAALCGTYTNGNGVIPINIVYLDSPATTSACTYTVYFLTTGGTVQYGFNPGNAGNMITTITAMEVSGT